MRRNSSSCPLSSCTYTSIQATGVVSPVVTPPPPIYTTRVVAPPVYSAPVLDADPITPGIQSTPGVVTPVGPPRVVGGGPGFGGPIVGGPVIGGPVVGGPVYGGPRYGYGGFSRVGAVPDLDPITPGFQTRPGVVTATGPSTIRPF